MSDDPAHDPRGRYRDRTSAAVRISLAEHGHLVDVRLVGKGGAPERNLVLHRGMRAGLLRVVETVEDQSRTEGVLK